MPRRRRASLLARTFSSHSGIQVRSYTRMLCLVREHLGAQQRSAETTCYSFVLRRHGQVPSSVDA
jgi:hypothetical protein